MTCFSFDARKILTTGEGGMVTTDDEEAAKRMRALRAHAASVSTLDRHTSTGVIAEGYPEVGFNYKLTDVQAAVGIVQVGRLDEIVAERRRLAARYEAAARRRRALAAPVRAAGYQHVYQSYGVRVVGERTQTEVMSSMAAVDVATRRLLGCHLEPVYKNGPSATYLPATEQVASDLVLIPLFVGLTEAEQDEVARTLRARSTANRA